VVSEDYLGDPEIVSKKKVLYVCHNHPTLHPGGAEAYALELHRAMHESEDFEPIFLSRIGSTVATERRPHSGTPFSTVDGDRSQYFFFTETSGFDFFYMTLRDKDVYTKYFHEFLLAHRPDVIHFQHTQFLGYDLLRQVRNTLPDAVIVYTLHELLPICHRDGQMVRTEHRNGELCHEASPRRCHECFPEISPQAFFMRKRFIQSHFSLVDLFLAPSHFLLERYVDWGIPREKIRFEDYGRRSVEPIAQSEENRPRTRIGFFGQISYFKGVNVLMEAMKLLSGEFPSEGEYDEHLWLYGANLELQAQEFQNRFRSLLQATEQNVTFVGRYDHADLPRLMANVDWVVVPSIWWENSPLVIQEAFLYGRPVICSDIGGMAEKVTNGVNGLHFRVGDPRSLARAIRRATRSPDTWQALRDGIPEVYKIEDAVTTISEIYRTLLERHKPLEVDTGDEAHAIP
jgi:glycosyltransferase involved in cell wall biosynthesis